MPHQQDVQHLPDNGVMRRSWQAKGLGMTPPALSSHAENLRANLRYDGRRMNELA